MVLVAALKVAGTAVSRVTQILLPLYLLPSDFGIFALAVFYSGFLALIGDLGMSTELVRRKERFEEAAQTAFTLRFGVSVGLVGVSAVLGWIISAAYRDPRLALPILVLGLGFVFQSLALVPRIMATRDLDFRRAAVPDNAGKFSTAFLTIALAVIGLAYWSPVFGTIIGAAIGAGLQMTFTRWKPKFRYDASLAREMVRFGQFVTLTSFANFVAHSVDNAIVGYFLGLGSLGLYAFAYSWGVYFTSNLTSILSTVSFPVLSRVRDDPNRFRRAFTENLRYYGYAAFCLGPGVLVLAPVFVSSLYGPTWEPAILPMQLLAPVGILLGIGGVSGDALFALGRSKTVFLVSACEVLFLLIALPIATVTAGLPGTSLAAVMGAALVATGLGRAVTRSANLDLGSWIASLAPSATAGLVASIVAGLFLGNQNASLLTLLVGFTIFITTYVVVLEIISRGRFLSEVRAIFRLAVLNRE